MEELIEKLERYYSMSMFKNIEERNRLNEEIWELEKKLGVEHTHFNGNLRIIKTIYENGKLVGD